MTQRQRQAQENNVAINAVAEFNKSDIQIDLSSVKRLDYCTAWTADAGKYEVLKSYNTIVAVYDSEKNELYDVLRYVYGYTATSAKHIAKFRNMHRSAHVFTYRSL